MEKKTFSLPVMFKKLFFFLHNSCTDFILVFKMFFFFNSKSLMRITIESNGNYKNGNKLAILMHYSNDNCVLKSFSVL